MSGPAILASERDRWLARRRELVTASDVPAILGEDPHRGPLAVWAAKIGAIKGVQGMIRDIAVLPKK